MLVKQTYLEYGQFVRVPLGDARGIHIHYSHLYVGAL